MSHELGDGVRRALRTFEQCEGVIGIGTPERQGAATVIDVMFRVEMPSAWRAHGSSPSGVRSEEAITFLFPADYPIHAPAVYLRADFPRAFPHILPGLATTRPRPCLYDGSLHELLSQRGFYEIVNQLIEWLARAARGTLIDPQQGWEPVRRDALEDFLIADADALRRLEHKGRRQFLRMSYLRMSKIDVIVGEVGSEIAVTLNSAATLFSNSESDKFEEGMSLAVVAWPDPDSSGRPTVTSEYLPETVSTFGELGVRAAAYGCKASLDNALSWLSRVTGKQRFRRMPIAVILCARRPCHLIGSTSSIELCPYILEVSSPLLPLAESTPIRLAGHRDAITPNLLRSMSDQTQTAAWILLGAGSLGSKIGLHLARSGSAPSVVVDNDSLSPHNAARHALTPDATGIFGGWVLNKAETFVRTIRALGQESTAYERDITRLLQEPSQLNDLLANEPCLFVNSTASVMVHETLASTPLSRIRQRIVETSLFADGRIGLLTLEGSSRNPTTGDLMSEVYEYFRSNPAVRDLVFRDTGLGVAQPIGQGCGSLTLKMSDARISMLAAPMSEVLQKLLSGQIPETGRLLVGVLRPNSISIDWEQIDIAPWIDLAPHSEWHIRLSPRAQRKIQEDVARYPNVETGGVLVGRFSEVARTFYVTDVLPPPEDSVRSASEFILGKRGLTATLREYANSAGNSLYCLGTWHSHLTNTGPSSTDTATAVAIGLSRLSPAAMVIFTPGRYYSLLAV